jgi:hypothetical protein
MKKTILFTSIALSLLISCADTTNNKTIIGNWQAVAWEAAGKPVPRNVETTSFTFTDKGAYSFENSGNKEEGTYKVEIDKLFTTAKGKQEIMVKIVKATNDSLVFDMNNGGQEETITMLKKK